MNTHYMKVGILLFLGSFSEKNFDPLIIITYCYNTSLLNVLVLFQFVNYLFSIGIEKMNDIHEKSNRFIQKHLKKLQTSLSRGET